MCPDFHLITTQSNDTRSERQDESKPDNERVGAGGLKRKEDIKRETETQRGIRTQSTEVSKNDGCG